MGPLPLPGCVQRADMISLEPKNALNSSTNFLVLFSWGWAAQKVSALSALNILKRYCVLQRLLTMKHLEESLLN